MNLIIVESPTKAKTITKFLDKSYKIESSYGHIRDLPKSKIGVDTENNFDVVYEIPAAAKKNVEVGFEASVGGGIPVIKAHKEGLVANKILSIMGIMNGTANYILTRMEEGMSYDDALKKAQELGYAEADPTGDVEGLDALGKVLILSNVVLGKNLSWEDVERKGITEITGEDVMKAKEEGKRWKLVRSAENQPDG